MFLLCSGSKKSQSGAALIRTLAERPNLESERCDEQRLPRFVTNLDRNAMALGSPKRLFGHLG